MKVQLNRTQLGEHNPGIFKKQPTCQRQRILRSDVSCCPEIAAASVPTYFSFTTQYSLPEIPYKGTSTKNPSHIQDALNIYQEQEMNNKIYTRINKGKLWHNKNKRKN